MSTMDSGLFAAFCIAGLVLAAVVVFQSKFQSILAWACIVVFFALAWNAIALT